ncbi:coniferyl aldehyde dehydrogenase [Limnobacter humi]|uniref:Aldehyde dehydrogenase n=1 Tax=Limnobacter humi TaxID=1778671 RepID=A0ABT1WI14_9BURK|nr:coniferyl aldehyde dehydrogenase [Limnobacter humi]MCQ8897166.1 coniferyl aldehyde dehydrogenase [Limnobacter humi]
MNAPSTHIGQELSAAELKATLESLRQAYRINPYPSWNQRREWLQKLSDMIYDNKMAFAAAISEDFGYRSPNDTLLAEVFPSLEGIRHAIKHGKSWMKVRKQGASIWFKPGSTALMPQPLGVIGVIVPWNYPLFLSAGPLVAALAAGNRAFIKMSEYTPRFSALLDQKLAQYLGRDVVQVVNGGPEVAAEFSRLPFDHILFTGSTPVGKMVMKAAAENLVPVTLELGGKSPAIITAETAANDARLKNAVGRVISGKSINAGQTCIAPDYLLVPEGCEDRVLAHAKDIVSRRFPDGVLSKDFTGIVSDRHATRLQRLTDEAAETGARIVNLMKTGDNPGRKVPLTFVLNAKNDTGLMQEEIFGPILPIVTYKRLDDALAYVNARPRPLALYLFDDNSKTQELVMQQTIAGGVCINETLFHIAQENLPFGGVGDSGMGHYHGKYGFDTMTKLKPIFKQARFNSAEMLAPPYGKTIKMLLDILTRKV